MISITEVAVFTTVGDFDGVVPGKISSPHPAIKKLVIKMTIHLNC
jgi:hypothetical protein